MSEWRLHERVKLAAEGRRWKLSEEEQFSVGRNTECDIVLQSMSVEGRHAVFEWNSKALCFNIRDLGGVNGTYVNNRPLRRSSVVLKHNDAIRFGCEKDHVFRMEECFPSKTIPNTKTTSPFTTDVPVSTPPQTTASGSVPSTTINQNLVHVPPNVQYVAVPSSPVQHVAVPSSPVQHGFMPMIAQGTGSPLTYAYAQSHHQSPVVTVTHPIPDYQPSIPIIGTIHNPQTPVQKSSSILSAAEMEDLSSTPNPSRRSDGRRPVDLENSPALNKASKLYGQPLWWGEETGASKTRSLELEFVKPNSQILRQLEPQVKRDSQKHSSKDILRMQAISNSSSSHDTWVIDIGGGAREKRSRDIKTRPRSAEPSPNRLTTRHDLSPVTKSPTSMKRSASISAPRSTQASPTRTRRRSQRAATPPVTSTKKPPPGSSPVHKGTKSSFNRSKFSTPLNSESTNSLSQPPPNPETPGTLHSTPTNSQSRTQKHSNQRKVKSSAEESRAPKTPNDETYTASMTSSEESSLNTSPLSEGIRFVTPDSLSHVNEGTRDGGKKTGSHRKQWANDEEIQVAPDSLMLASIEARMRRLGKLAHQTARQMTVLKKTIQEGQKMRVEEMDYLTTNISSPVLTRREQNMPEWKFFNKEANSIFRNIRVVEKWLQDIDTSLNCIKTESQGMEESIDGIVYASDGEIYLDTTDNLHSGSEEG